MCNSPHLRVYVHSKYTEYVYMIILWLPLDQDYITCPHTHTHIGRDFKYSNLHFMTDT